MDLPGSNSGNNGSGNVCQNEMNRKQNKEAGVVVFIRYDDIIQDEREKQYGYTNQTDEKGLSQLIQPRFSEGIFIIA